MTWQEETIPMLRVLINDNDLTNLTYSDDRLEETLIVAATQVKVDMQFTAYTITVSTNTISPDPAAEPDTDFMHFIVLKAACIIDRGNMRVRAMSAGIEARCGPAVMKTLQTVPAFKDLIELGYCGVYEKSRFEWILGNSTYIRGILSPFTNGNFDPDYYTSSIHDIRVTRYGC